MIPARATLLLILQCFQRLPVNSTPSNEEKNKEMEPMWPTLVAMAAAGGLYAALPPEMTIDGPRWLILAVVAAFLVPTEVFHAMGKHIFCRVCGYSVISVVTVVMITCVARLVQAIPARTVPPAQLLLSAAMLWLTNVLVFAVWYWRLDGGGPHKRDLQETHSAGAFLFPQMTIPDADKSSEEKRWLPSFVDYLFLAFNTSTALSPTDVPVLSPWAKILMMIQALISLTIVVLLAARAVNVL